MAIHAFRVQAMQARPFILYARFAQTELHQESVTTQLAAAETTWQRLGACLACQRRLQLAAQSRVGFQQLRHLRILRLDLHRAGPPA